MEYGEFNSINTSLVEYERTTSPGYEAARRRVSFEEAPLDCAEEKRKRVCARGERRMQRMEHCHDWAEKEQCDRSRESRVRTSELRRSRIENKNADLKRLF